MRKILAATLFFVIFLGISMPFYAIAQEDAELYEWRVLHNGTRLYKDATISQGENIVALLEQSAIIELIMPEPIQSAGYNFYYIEANGKAGYVLEGDIYYSRKEYVYDTVYKRVITPALFGKANIYLYPDTNSEIAGNYKDGEKATVVESTGEYGEFEKIVYGEGYAYMQSKHLTNGLSKGQSVAIAIAAIMLALATLTIYLLIKAKKRLHSQTHLNSISPKEK